MANVGARSLSHCLTANNPIRVVTGGDKCVSACGNEKEK